MTYVDTLYRTSAELLMQEGYLDKEINDGMVRPKWEDGESAYTKYLPQQIFRYAPGVVPLTGYRKTAWKTAIRELLWIYQDRSNDVLLLKEKYGVKYWDAWQNDQGNLGTAYGYQVAKPFRSPETGKMTDQIHRLLENLKNDPANRRHFMSLLDVDDMADMTLVPCAFLTLWTVTQDRLNMTLIQRSGDFLTAAAPGGINAFQYYVLMRMVASASGYKPGEMVHFVQNLHIYDRHVPILKEVLSEEPQACQPVLEINPDVDDFFAFTEKDFTLKDYRPNRRTFVIPVAI